jgi:hypothetical protein
MFVAFSVLVAGCGGGGGSSGVSATSYVGSVCSASKSLETAVSAQEQEIKTKLPSILGAAAAHQSSALPQAKKLLQTFADNVTAAAKSWQKSVHAAGTPHVGNGASIAAKLNAAVDKFVAAVGTFRSEVGSLPTADATTFTQAIRTSLTKFQSAASSSGKALTNLSSAELDAAAKKTPSCKGIVS